MIVDDHVLPEHARVAAEPPAPVGVAEHDDGHSSWGNFVYIQHEIDGQTVFSGYAHMQRGSSPLVAGDVIKVGDFIGLVGATGEATGPHLHFTISIGTKTHYIDPYTWMVAHTTG